jgi:hypothetical protein
MTDSQSVMIRFPGGGSGPNADAYCLSRGQ